GLRPPREPRRSPRHRRYRRRRLLVALRPRPAHRPPLRRPARRRRGPLPRRTPGHGALRNPTEPAASSTAAAAEVRRPVQEVEREAGRTSAQLGRGPRSVGRLETTEAPVRSRGLGAEMTWLAPQREPLAPPTGCEPVSPP